MSIEEYGERQLWGFVPRLLCISVLSFVNQTFFPSLGHLTYRHHRFTSGTSRAHARLFLLAVCFIATNLFHSHTFPLILPAPPLRPGARSSPALIHSLLEYSSFLPFYLVPAWNKLQLASLV
ncbi:hypothetical protein B0H14DRAFT_2700325 [Mycena olivaceomarginata]|nr:hypothetical protein B0H14DRAFT_2700325 [Mycena olivaceomarginata]